ncbi:1,2-phenylacetyl-CoA epoxidase subunit PaaD [Parazoarcus communis]|uniref:Phenylacetate-CoA oxygenase subunit PaaJ n=1 Tax=Parazoarcus communis SWub3 = DSM 12120 TaxID=1121029 RepID=A0A323UUM9_9RHOO|nr:1,2-phenylacetyl-CoA epoxidase subunit PaaD [Parazoarcus communis]NMG70857.1 phenylacetate-CoA oxygenase subunit PaaJ [Parazoarcus communis SWub3 = DSM 12120]PZA16249.1 phenylacetate-CoA oxygenase subunit PaaJ [Azoarcus communis] [Parazoarcus communis SWub3 = DSM 12120]
MLTESQAWQVLDGVPDPEVPVVSVVELGIIRELRCSDDGLTVVVTPTYSGCPATEVIGLAIRDSLLAAGAPGVKLETRLDPPWTSDWIGDAAREKLRAYGIVPPGDRAVSGAAQPIRFVRKRLTCPRCGSNDTERLSEFGSTACKATWRCRSCLEPFEYFKPI